MPPPPEPQASWLAWVPVALVLLALAKLTGAVFTDSSGEPQDTYYVSSRSMVAITTIGEDGQRRTEVKEDSDVRTNIRGLSSGDVKNLAPPPGIFGYLDRY